MVASIRTDREFLGLLKRAIKGTYISVEPFHLGRYVDEQASASMSAKARTPTASPPPFAGSSASA